MKHIYYMALSLLIASSIFAGCQNAEYGVLKNQAYITQTKTNPNTVVKVFIDKENVTANLSVRLSGPAKTDCAFKLSEDAATLMHYNSLNYTDYQFLTPEQYTLSSNQVTIHKGETISESIDLNILPLTDEMKNSGKKFAVAISLSSDDGNASILTPGARIIYILDPAIVTNVPVFGPQNNAYIKLEEDLALSEWTVEFCVNMSMLGKDIGELNNQALLDACSELGEADGQIYTRFGDAPIAGDVLQIKTQGSQMNSQMHFETNKWYHIAWVCTGTKLYLYVDGKLDNSIDLPGKVTNISKEKCKIGNSDYLRSDLRMSELRLWTRALKQKEIANNMYAVNPSSDGLFFYFKLNEGSGINFTDATGKGNKAYCVQENWMTGVRLNENN